MNDVHFVQWVCGGLLIAIVAALIFSASFRRDSLRGTGSARVFGILSVEGAAVVLLCALFLVGLLYPLFNGNIRNGKLVNGDKDEKRLLDYIKFSVRTGSDEKAGTNATVKVLINNTPYTLRSGSGELFSRNSSGETAPLPLNISYGQLKNAAIVLAHDDKTRNGEGGSWQIGTFSMLIKFKGRQDYTEYKTWNDIGWLSNRAYPRQVAAYSLQ
uniref:Uncharacterized protein n=1 Tax=Candidatus Kentrum sp. LPFa TaxID=2126335 RepID=A0A450VX84_9GAMM|nr:MAG: hypothetical protein BECKLPF1236B_GA0070989_10083 [Candidatus Kentron sp. LPFa]